METTKKQLVNWLSKQHDNCGFTDYFGYKMKIEDFEKEMNKKKNWELIELIFNTSIEGQQFIESFQR